MLKDDYQEMKKENAQKRAVIEHLLTPKITESEVAGSNALTTISQPHTATVDIQIFLVPQTTILSLQTQSGQSLPLAWQY